MATCQAIMEAYNDGLYTVGEALAYIDEAPDSEDIKQMSRDLVNGLPLDDSGAYPDSETDPSDEDDALSAEGQELQYLGRHGLSI